MTRTTQQVFDDHRKAIEAADLGLILADYADNAILLTTDGPAVGKEAIRGFFENAFKSFPNLKITFDRTAVEDDLFLLQWFGDSDVATIPHGVAAFIIRDGLIQRQAEWFTVVPKEG
jgi:hypothetical protein